MNHIQKYLFPELAENKTSPKPVNVASVPLRSPFRYPGGKTWFVPTFRDWLASIPAKPRFLIEPFAGGGIISLTALFEDLVDIAVMVELDDDVAAVWKAVTNGHIDWLADRIMNFDLTKKSLLQELERLAVDDKEQAFQTILKNRTAHGGILAKGSGLVKKGESGKGIRSRWYPKTLARRLREMKTIIDRIDFKHEDGLSIMQRFSNNDDAVFFIDPPYTAGGKRAGSRLYTHFDLDHEHLFFLAKSLRGEFLMTYDNADEVRAMAQKHNFQKRLIPMTNTHNATMNELVIGRDLTWMDQYPAVCEPKDVY